MGYLLAWRMAGFADCDVTNPEVLEAVSEALSAGLVLSCRASVVRTVRVDSHESLRGVHRSAFKGCAK